MTTLIIQLPAHQRQSSDPASADTAAGASASAQKEVFYVLTANGQTAVRQGMSAISALPRAETVVVVTAPTDVSRHRLSSPKAPSAPLRPEPPPPGARFFATPAAAAPAERWLGHAVQAQLPAEHLMQSARSMWNLLQFELTPSSKGWQAVTDQWRQFRRP